MFCYCGHHWNKYESSWHKKETPQEQRSKPKITNRFHSVHVGGTAVTGKARPVKIWLFVLVTHILAFWWLTAPLSRVRSQHLCSPPSLTAVASPYAIPTKTKEHCCLLRYQVLWTFRANSFMSHSRWPASWPPGKRNCLKSDTWSRDGAIFASVKMPRAPPGFDVWVIIMCSIAGRPRAWFALWGAGGRSSAILARRRNPGILTT